MSSVMVVYLAVDGRSKGLSHATLTVRAGNEIPSQVRCDMTLHGRDSNLFISAQASAARWSLPSLSV